MFTTMINIYQKQFKLFIAVYFFLQYFEDQLLKIIIISNAFQDQLNFKYHALYTIILEFIIPYLYLVKIVNYAI